MKSIATFLVSPLMLPGLVVGIAMLQYFRATRPEGSTAQPVAGARCHRVAVRDADADRRPGALRLRADDAARTLGLSYPRAVLRVMVPVLAPSFITGALFGFLASVDNYPVSIFLTDVYHRTLPIQFCNILESRPTRQ